LSVYTVDVPKRQLRVAANLYHTLKTMIENLDALIDKNLEILYTDDSYHFFRTSFLSLNDDNYPPFDSERLAEIMEQKGLLTLEYSKRQRCDKTELGYKIHGLGGWLEYNRLQAEKEEEEKREVQKLEIEKQEERKLERSKLSNEVKLAKWQVRTFWIIFPLTIIMTAYTIYDIYAARQSAKQDSLEEVELKKRLDHLDRRIDSMIRVEVEIPSLRKDTLL
jgi:hypothetical protein